MKAIFDWVSTIATLGNKMLAKVWLWVKTPEPMAILLSSITAITTIGFVMWLNGMIFGHAFELPKTHFPLICESDKTRTAISSQASPPTNSPTHLIKLNLRPFSESVKNNGIKL